MNIISLCKLLTTQELHQEKVGQNSLKLRPFLIWSQKNKEIHLKFREIVRYQRDGALVGAFVSHHYGPVSNSRGDDIREFSLLLVLTLAPKGFSPALFRRGFFFAFCDRDEGASKSPQSFKKVVRLIKYGARRIFILDLRQFQRAKNESLRLDQSEKAIKWSLTSNLKRTET